MTHLYCVVHVSNGSAHSYSLQKDIEEVRRLTGVSVSRASRPNSAVIEFDPISVAQYVATDTSSGSQLPLFHQCGTTMRRDILPSQFLVTVPRYYPHRPPLIRCLDSRGLSFPPHLDADGTVHHVSLESEWSPIKTLQSVVQVLHDLRVYISSQTPSSIGATLVPATPSRSSNPGMLTPQGVEGVSEQFISSPSGTHSVHSVHRLETHREEAPLFDDVDSAMVTDDDV